MQNITKIGVKDQTSQSCKTIPKLESRIKLNKVAKYYTKLNWGYHKSITPDKIKCTNKKSEVNHRGIKHQTLKSYDKDLN